jgi:hypothetical protein
MNAATLIVITLCSIGIGFVVGWLMRDRWHY